MQNRGKYAITLARNDKKGEKPHCVCNEIKKRGKKDGKKKKTR